MTRIIIVISLLVLVATAQVASENEVADGVLRLAYNPTYDLWFFLPSGRPGKLPENVKEAYNKHRAGGVCYIPTDDWFYCASGRKI